MLVCLDTHIVVWGVRKHAEESQKHLIPRAQAFLEDLDNQHTRVLIPSIVVGEYLTALDPADHAGALRVLNAHFQLPSYDVAAAAFAAQLVRRKLALKGETATAADGATYKMTKPQIVCDCQILAVAKTRGAAILYTHDTGLQRLAEGVVETKELPEDLTVQMPLGFDTPP